VAGEQIWIKVSSKDTEGRFTACEVLTEARTGPPRHAHRYEDQWFHVIEGDILFELGGRKVPAPPGTSLFVPRDVPHSYRNLGDRPGRMLLVAVPGGLDIFYAEMDGVPPEKSRHICEKHGVDTPTDT